MDLSVVIVNYNTEEHLEKCLRSIFKFDYENNIEVVVVDNNSTNEVIHTFPDLFPKVKFVFNESNAGFGTGCNLGVKNSSGRFIAFVNPDILFTKNCFDPIIGYMKNNSDIGFCGGLLTNEKNELIYSFNYFPGIHWEYLEARGTGTGQKIKKIMQREEITATYTPFEIDWFIGAFMVTLRDVFDRINGFDDKNFFLYYEDVDIQLQAKKLGKRNICLPAVRMVHYERSSVRTFVGENLYYLHMHKSKMLYYYKNTGFFKRNIIRLLNIWGMSIRAFALFFRRKFGNKKIQKLYQYYFLLGIYFSGKRSLLKLHLPPENFILKYIRKKGLDKFVIDEYWEKA
jgi:N-acetylglucosaminyl-diphospho-decaprenol L-rhamnosyltransferase